MLSAPAVASQIANPPNNIAVSSADQKQKLPMFSEWAQVRIERRVIIRIPRQSPSNMSSLSRLERSEPTKWREKKVGKCLPMSDIQAVQMSGERYLDLMMRDRKRIRAQLEKKCQSRSFYSGFYLEKSSDGRICAGRDILHSRTGMKCEIERFRQMVPD